MGSTFTHREERPVEAKAPRPPRREPPLATRVSVRRVMRAFKRV